MAKCRKRSTGAGAIDPFAVPASENAKTSSAGDKSAGPGFARMKSDAVPVGAQFHGGNLMLRRFVCAVALLPVLGALSLTASAAGTLDRLRTDKTIRLAVRDDAPPFSFKNANGEQAGYMVDLCRKVTIAIASQLKLPELKIAYVPVTAENRFDVIASGNADLLCEPTSVTLSRRERVDFSLPTFIDGASLMVKGAGPNSITALAGKKVGVLGGTTTEQGLRVSLKDAKIDAEVMPAKTHIEGLKALQSGAVAAYFADRSILLYLAMTAPDSKDISIANEYFSFERYALAMARNDDDFRLAVDRALSGIYRSGEYTALFAATFGPQAQPTDLLRTLYLISAIPE